MRHRKPVIGLCGGIGAGKSAVARAFEALGCLVIDSDALSHAALRQPDVLATLQSWWGPEVVTPDGQPDRSRIAALVFQDPVQKERLERLLYPLIAHQRADMIQAVENHSAIKAIVIDSPLLFESNLDRECDTVVYVDAGEVHRVRRLQLSRGWDAEELRRRERWQLSLDEKRTRAAFVINNDGRVEDLQPQVAGILQSIVARHLRQE